MIDHPNEDDKKLWKKFLRSESTEESRRAFDRWKHDEERRMMDAVRNTLLVGNMQIAHMSPQFTIEDARIGFDSPEYNLRCKWMRNNPGSEMKLRECLMNERAFYLAGLSGCGKSVFSKAMARQFIIDRGDQALLDKHFLKYVNFGKMMDAMKAEKFAFYDYIHKEVTSCEILFLDDIGSERNREHSEDVLFKILDTRLFAKTRTEEPFRTFFSSNFLINDLPYNERILRRIRDMAREVVVAGVQKPTVEKPGSGNALDSNPSYS